MSSKVRTRGKYIRASPNEETAFIMNQMKEKRKKRLLEVREQEKDFARSVRENLQRKKKEETLLLEEHLKECAEQRHKKELKHLKEELRKHYQSIGQGQRNAVKVAQEEERLLELRLLLTSQQRRLAKMRQQVAMKELSIERKCRGSSTHRVATTRAMAQAHEREQARLSLPKKSNDQFAPNLIMELEPYLSDYLSTKRVKGVECFASTYFHLPENLVDREVIHDNTEPDANQVALQVGKEENYRQQHTFAVLQEQKEKARLRHKHALAKLKLEKDKDTILKDLSLLVREDRAHRQKVLQQIPNNVFQSVQDRVQQQREEQRELEHVFEKLVLNGQENIDPCSPIHMSPKHLPIPDPNRPHPLTPPPVPIQLSSLATPLPEARESQEQQQQPATVEGKSSVVVPCGTACEESDLSIHTIPPSERGTSLSGTNPSNYSSSSNANTGDSAVTSGETTTSKGTGLSKLVGLIRSQQEILREVRQKKERDMPSSGTHVPVRPPDLSISTVSASTDHDNSNKYNSESPIPHPNVPHAVPSTLSSGIFTALMELDNDSDANDKPLINQVITTEGSTTYHEGTDSASNMPSSTLPIPPPDYHHPVYNPYYNPYYYTQWTNHPAGIGGWSNQGIYPPINNTWASQYPLSGGSVPYQPVIPPQRNTEDNGVDAITNGSVPDPFITPYPSHTPTNIDHGVSSGDHRVTPCDHSVSSGDHRVSSSDHRVTPCDHRVTPRDHSVSSSDHSVSSSDRSVTPCDRSVTPCDHSVTLSDESLLQLTQSTGFDGGNIAISNSDSVSESSRSLPYSMSSPAVMDSPLNNADNSTTLTSFNTSSSPDSVHHPVSDNDSVQRKEFISNLLLSLNIDKDSQQNETSDQNENETSDQNENETSDQNENETSDQNENETSDQNESTTTIEGVASQTELDPGHSAAAKSFMITMTTPPPQTDTSSSNSSDEPGLTPVEVPETAPLTTDIVHVTSSSSVERQLSLQEAFLQRKRDFVDRSQTRVTQLGRRARERERSHSLSSSIQQRHVSFSTPLVKAESQMNTGTIHSRSDKVSTDGKRQVRGAGGVRQTISLKEMHERNSRLYSQLPEVKQRQHKATQQELYAKNREKAKTFHEKLRKKMKEKTKK